MDRSELWFGIDGGAKSIGWAVLRLFEDGFYTIIACGSHIFSDGVINEKGRFHTATAERRAARQMRRQIYRTRRRKRKVANAIRRHLCKFDTAKMIDPIMVRGLFETQDFSVKAFASAIYHIAGRRGFQSLAKPAPIIDPIEESIGAEMYRLQKEGKPVLLGKPKGKFARKRSGHSGLDYRADARPKRVHIKDEFNALWARAAALHPDRFTDAARADIFDAVFHQRDLKDCSDSIGKCTYIPSEDRVRKDHPDYQRFRIRSELSNVKLVTDDGVPKAMTDYPEALAGMVDELMEPGAKMLTWENIAGRIGKVEKIKMHIPAAAKHEKEGRRGIDSILVPDPDGVATPMAKIGLTATNALYACMVEHCIIESEAKTMLLDNGTLEKTRIDTKGISLTGEMLTLEEIAELGEGVTEPSVKVIYNQTKRVVDQLVRRYGKPDIVKVESAREIGRGRKAYESQFQFERRMAKKEQERIERIANREANEANPLRRRSELERLDEMYGTGGRCFIFPDDKAEDVGHLLPLAKSADDRLENKIPMGARANAMLGERPIEELLAENAEARHNVEIGLLELSESNPELWEKVAWRFQPGAMKSCELGFRVNAANEYRYAERLISWLGMASVCKRVRVPRAQLTGMARKIYRIGRKDRTNHRHHAEDAILIALTPHKGNEFPIGITGEDIKKAVAKAAITHRVKKAKMGQLHEDGARGAKTDVKIWRGNHYRMHSTGGNWATEIFDVDGKWQAVTIPRFHANQKGFRAGTTFRPTRNAKLVKRVFVDDVLTIAGERVSGFKGDKEVVKFMPDRSKPRRRWRVQKMSAGKFVLACVNASGSGKEMETWTISAKQLQASLIL